MKKPRIVIDVQSLAGKTTGYGSYLGSLLSGIKQLPGAKNFEIILLDKVRHNLSTPRRIFWDQVQLPFWALVKRADLLFVPAFSAPFLYPGKKILVVHDLVAHFFQHYFSKTSLWYWKNILPSSAKHVTQVITISQNTKKDLVEQLKITEQKITVIPLAADPFYQLLAPSKEIEEVLLKYQLRDTPFVLSVSTLEPRKNYVRLIKAFATCQREGAKLVLVGKKGWQEAEIFNEIKQLHLQEKVIWLDYVSKEELRVLYNACLFFILPSLYEGFGLPILEAMACGAPVISSDRASLPEVVGEAGLLVNPYEVEDLKEKMNLLFMNHELRLALEKKSLVQVQKFSWLKTARETLAVWQKVLNHV